MCNSPFSLHGSHLAPFLYFHTGKMLANIVFWIFVGCTAINCGYAVFLFRRIFKLRPAGPCVAIRLQQCVSVIICARNEATNLKENLPLVLKQEFKEYEVIVVNDHSTDDTSAVLRMLQSEYPHLKVINQTNDQLPSGKKAALAAGVAASTSEFLVFTDADCAPAGPNWLVFMADPMFRGKDIVAGYSGYIQQPGMLNTFIGWETMHTFLQYATYCVAGIPYMAVGRNMACTKAVFLDASRSRIWSRLPSGDDDLLVREAANGNNMTIVSHPGAFTMSSPVRDWKSYRAQKQRHLSTGKYYKPIPRFLLGVYSGSHAAVWLGFLVLLGTQWYAWALALMYFRCMLHWSCWFNAAARVGARSLIKFFPFADFAWMLYNFALSPYVFFKNKTTWK